MPSGTNFCIADANIDQDATNTMKIIKRRKTANSNTFIHTTDEGHEIRTTTDDGHLYSAEYKDELRWCGCMCFANSRRTALRDAMRAIAADDLE